MTVAELVRRLQEFDPASPVYRYDEWRYVSVHEAIGRVIDDMGMTTDLEDNEAIRAVLLD